MTPTKSAAPAQSASRSKPAARSSLSKAEASYALLRKRILDGTYGPGYRLVLDQLARETGVSTIPLREALRRLQSDGFVQVVRNVGARVAEFNTSRLEHTLQVLARLEGYATAVAAPLMSATDIAASRAINKKMLAALENFDPAGFTALNREFHFSIYQRCPDDHLARLLETEWARLDHMRRSSFSYVPGRARMSVAEHDEMLRLIAAGAPGDDIERVARAHKIGTANALHEHHP